MCDAYMHDGRIECFVGWVVSNDNTKEGIGIVGGVSDLW